jgi:hypothetical protein
MSNLLDEQRKILLDYLNTVRCKMASLKENLQDCLMYHPVS